MTKPWSYLENIQKYITKLWSSGFRYYRYRNFTLEPGFPRRISQVSPFIKQEYYLLEYYKEYLLEYYKGISLAQCNNMKYHQRDKNDKNRASAVCHPMCRLPSSEVATSTLSRWSDKLLSIECLANPFCNGRCCLQIHFVWVLPCKSSHHFSLGEKVLDFLPGLQATNLKAYAASQR